MFSVLKSAKFQAIVELIPSKTWKRFVTMVGLSGASEHNKLTPRFIFY
jgi:hypothetical protein